jgi:methylglutaconyl-CoA hydratase
MPETISVNTRCRGVAQVTMNREKQFNAFDEAMIAELDAAFQSLAKDPAVRVILLASNGPHFSAGADLKWMKRSAEATQEWNLADARRFAAMLSHIGNCSKPTVARIQGAALGGGVGLAAACDITIAADNAGFSVSEVKFGILPAVIGPYLINAVGKRQATRLALTATRLSAGEALAIGLVHRVVPLALLDSAVDATLDELLAAGPQAQREVKQLFAQIEPGPVTPDVRDLTARTISRVRATQEAKEGFAAFHDERPAAWIPASASARESNDGDSPVSGSAPLAG